MLYPKNREKELSDALFREPTAEYRGAPFWAWNDKLEPDELRRQIGELQEMGFGGFHMHPRDGMATPYLSEEHLSLIKLCNETARSRKMLTWLYDEDRYPSGAAGGLVTKDRRLRETYLCFTREQDAALLPKTDPGDGSPFLIASYDVVLAEDGGMLECPYASGEPKGTVWHAVCRTRDDMGWYNGQAYIDVMMPAAVKKFIEITYDKFADAVGEDFGVQIPAIFTDEPRMTRARPIDFSHSGADREKTASAAFPPTAVKTYDKEIAWSADFLQTFRAAYGYDLTPYLPELIWQRADGKPSRARYLYHDHRAAKFCAAYLAQIRDWCHAHGVAMTGHFLGENTLDSQTESVGDLMRGYPYFDIPGMDLLMDNLLPNIGKQVQSVAHQCGKEATLSELYGVTGWEYDFRHHKLQGDWHAAMGISVRVPHLSWYSMRGDAKRDYPASIHYQSAWYREYKYLEDHYARINTAMTRGKPLTEIAVVHPVESNWLEYAANDMTGDRRTQLQTDYESIWQWLLYAPLDFDYLCESTLPQFCGKTEKPLLPVGEMAYKTVIVAGMETIRGTTVRLLLEFLHRGGRVLIVGAPPKYVDACVPQADDPLCALLREAEAVPFQKTALLTALEAHRQVSFRLESGVDAGKRGEDWLYNYRQDGEARWLFLAAGVRMPGAGKKGTYPELDGKQVKITIKGRWKPTLYDTLTGEIRPVSYTLTAHDTVLHRTLWCCDSLLLHLAPAAADDTGFDAEEKADAPYASLDWKQTVAVRRSEPNVLLLDLAEWSEDGETWQPAEELRRIDRALRQKHPDTKNGGVQPWAIPPEEIKHHIRLRFPIRTAFGVDVHLAYEAAEEVLLDGKAVELQPDGWFTDRHILTAPLPRLTAGEHTLTVKVPFGKRASLENLFLLGEFDVSLRGVQAELIPCAENCGFGDLAVQGMPFYGGPVTYELPFELQEDADVTLFARRYAGAVLTASLDGKPCGTVAFPPYRLPLGTVAAGKHTLTVTDWLTRANSFAALHNLTGDLYKGKGYWYPKGDGFAYEYQIMQSGLLLSPRLELRKIPR